MAFDLYPDSLEPLGFIGEAALTGSATIAVYADGVNITSYCLWDGTTITDSLSNIKGLTIRLLSGSGAAQGDEFVMYNTNTGQRIFAGYIKELTRELLTVDTYLEELLVQDYTRLIDEVEDGVTTEQTGTEFALLSSLFGTYCPSIIVSSAFCTKTEVETIETNDAGLRSVLNELAAENDRTWYVDFEKYLHWFDSGDESAPFGVSDNPNGTTTFPFRDLTYTQDVVNDDVRGSFVCYEPGLYAGQTIQITATAFSWSAQAFLITEVRADLITGELDNEMTFAFTVSFGNVPQRMTSHLPDSAEPEDDMLLSNLKIDCDKWWGTAVGTTFGILGMNFLSVQTYLQLPHGDDTSKPASPHPGDVYVATDTNRLYFCFTTGTWTLLLGGTSLGANKTYTAQPITLTAGEAFSSFGQIGYPGGGSKIYKTDADSASNMPAVVMCVSDSISADADGLFIPLTGFVRYDSWTWTAGDLLVPSAIASGTITTAPLSTDEYEQIIGIAMSATIIQLLPIAVVLVPAS